MARVWFVILVTWNGSIASGESLPPVIQQAWQVRQAGIRSFRYECDVEESEFVSNKQFAEPDPVGADTDASKVVVLHRHFIFEKQGAKIAATSVGEQWDSDASVISNQTFKAAFNGTESRRLLQFSKDLGEIFPGPDPGDDVTVNINHTAIWLWYAPETFLGRVRGPSDGWRVVRENTTVGGIECIELTRSRDSSQWVVHVFVDPARAYLPVLMEQRHAGVTTHNVSIQYVKNAEAGYNVASWIDKHFSAKGRPSRTTTYTVTDCAINQTISDDDFEVRFPVGTHVVKKTDDTREYFVQVSAKELRKMSRDDYYDDGVSTGPTPSGRRWQLWASAAVVAALTLALGAKYGFLRRH